MTTGRWKLALSRLTLGKILNETHITTLVAYVPIM